MTTRDDHLRPMQTGMYATTWAPARGNAATVVVGTWNALEVRDRRNIPLESVYGCVVCHRSLTRGQVHFWILYNQERTPFLVLTSCERQTCVHQVADTMGFAGGV